MPPGLARTSSGSTSGEPQFGGDGPLILQRFERLTQGERDAFEGGAQEVAAPFSPKGPVYSLLNKIYAASSSQGVV